MKSRNGIERIYIGYYTAARLKEDILRDFHTPIYSRSKLVNEVRQIHDYLGLKSRKINMKLNMKGLTCFQNRVFRALRQVPYGMTITYKVLASMLGAPDASRAVGNALASNPFPLVIPCHRVLRTDKTAGKFSAPGGSRLKRLLITMESHVRRKNRKNN